MALQLLLGVLLVCATFALARVFSPLVHLAELIFGSFGSPLLGSPSAFDALKDKRASALKNTESLRSARTFDINALKTRSICRSTHTFAVRLLESKV